MEDLFGKPNEGIHSYRVCNIAIIDVVMTVLFAFFISIIFNVNFVVTMTILFILGIISHRMVGVKTTVDKLLFN